MCVGAIVPAGGAGKRLGMRRGKAFVRLNGTPLLAHTLKALQKSSEVKWIVVAARASDRQRVKKLLCSQRITKALPPCLGGASRSESVANALAALPSDARWVLIHDAARPCVSSRLIKSAVMAAKRFDAVVCALPASVTVKAVDKKRLVRLTLDRRHLWLVQTPQVFRRDLFVKALALSNHSLRQFPDDAAVMESAGFGVRVIAGDGLNLKVTTKSDCLLAEAILANLTAHSRQNKSQACAYATLRA